MKKLLIILLGMTLTFTGCGNLSTDEKEDLVEQFAELDEEDFIELLEDARYTKVNGDYFTSMAYVKGEGIKGKEIEAKDMYDFYDDEMEYEIYGLAEYAGFFFDATIREETKDGYCEYYIAIGSEYADLRIALHDKDGKYIASSSFDYDFDEGTLELVGGSDKESDHYKSYEKIGEKREETGKKYFEKTFKELDKLIN